MLGEQNLRAVSSFVLATSGRILRITAGEEKQKKLRKKEKLISNCYLFKSMRTACVIKGTQKEKTSEKSDLLI